MSCQKRDKSLKLFIVLMLVFCVALICACESKSSDDSDGDQEQAQFTRPDGDNGTTTPNVDGDKDTPTNLPLCKPICDKYCNLMKECAAAGSIPGEVYAGCLSECSGIAAKGSYDKKIGCGEAVSCTAYNSCTKNGVDASFQCDPGKPPVQTDGDVNEIELPDIENEQAEVVEKDTIDYDRPPGVCDDQSHCQAGFWCDKPNRKCVKTCDPYATECETDEVCSPFSESPLYKGLCVPKNDSLADVGAPCTGRLECRPELICSPQKRCEKVCNPKASVSECEEGLKCMEWDDSKYDVATCAFCDDSKNQCPYGKECIDGYCKAGRPCTAKKDCNAQEACIHGLCAAGCEKTGCANSGFCDTTTGYCHSNVCRTSCAANEDCNRSECGPKCSTKCQPPQTCAYDPSCYPDLFCCVDKVDCREMPSGFCGEITCSTDTGTCFQQCPKDGCGWGQECTKHTNYKCQTGAIPTCGIDTFWACADMCTVCYNPGGWPPVEMGPCILKPDMNCGKNGAPPCIPVGVQCMVGPQYAPCCEDGECCATSSGSSVCCPKNECVQGVGCEKVDGDEDDFTCPDCDAIITGTWEKETGSSCPAPVDDFKIQRYTAYPCYFSAFEVVGGILDWGVEYCGDSYKSWEFKSVGGYDKCTMFWDATNNEFVSICEKSGASPCKLKYVKKQ